VRFRSRFIFFVFWKDFLFELLSDNCQKPIGRKAWWLSSVSPTLGRLRLENAKFKASLDYIMNSRSAWILSEPYLKNETKEINWSLPNTHQDG
jgi:hypothetical protein